MTENICGATAKSTGDPCQRPAGWGTENDEGRCKFHGGRGGDIGDSGGAPEQNTNSVTHGAYAQANPYYTEVLNDEMRALVDAVFEEYMRRYRAKHGGDPMLGIETELFRIAVTHAKDIGLDRWANEKPEELDSGHPLVDKETERDFNPEDGSVTINKYKESVVQSAQSKLSRDRRMWLKDLGLLEDPETQKADAIGKIDFTLSTEDKQGLAEALDGEPET